MSDLATRPSIAIPPEIDGLAGAVANAMHPLELWLFGSRARGDNRPDSDWDLVAVLPDDAPEDMMDPVVAWTLVRDSAVQATLLATRLGDLRAIWGLPNTLGYHLARDGVRLRVG